MTEPTPEPARSWAPIGIAGAVAILVVAAAVVFQVVRPVLDDREQEAVVACEAAHVASALLAIVSGQLYDPTQWRDYAEVVATHGDGAVAVVDLDPGVVEGFERAAEVYQDEGRGTVMVVWRLDDGTYAQCGVEVDDGLSVPASAVVSRLEIGQER